LLTIINFFLHFNNPTFHLLKSPVFRIISLIICGLIHFIANLIVKLLATDYYHPLLLIMLLLNVKYISVTIYSPTITTRLRFSIIIITNCYLLLPIFIVNDY
jgi:hypothetical protein